MSHNRAEIVRVKDVRHYPDFSAMLANEDTSKIVPGSSPTEVETLLHAIYPPDRERLGVVVLDISTESKPSYVQPR
jgi:ASC-1-like (ASCH) protein